MGQFTGTLTLGTTTLTSMGDYDVFVARLSATGQWQWAQRVGSPSADTGEGIAVDAAGNVLISGSWATSPFVAKFTSAGVPQWVTQVAGKGYAYRVALAADGTAYAAGTVLGTASFGATSVTSVGYAGAFVARLDASGQWQWVRAVGGSGASSILGLAVDNQDRLLVGGNFETQAVFGSQTLTTATGVRAAFVAQLTSQGQWQWVRQSEGNGYAEAQGLTVDSQANVWITGPFFGGNVAFGPTELTHVGTGANAYVAKLDSDGQWQWARAATGAGGGDVGWAVATDPNGNGYVTGVFNSSSLALEGLPALAHSSQPAEDLFVSQLDANGTWQWALAAGDGTTGTVGYGIAVDAQRNLTVLGHFRGAALDLGGLRVSAGNAGTGSVGYVARLAASAWTNLPTLRAHPQADGSTLLTSSAPSGNQFYRNQQPLAGATGTSYRVASGASGAYTVQTTAAGFRPTASAPVQVGAVVTKAVEPHATAGWSVYPNPGAGGQVTVQLAGQQSSGQIQLLNVMGQLLYTCPLRTRPDGRQTLELGKFGAGSYLLRLVTGQQTSTQRVHWQ
ncbi:SBBP repeat-containing protein [Hymenobacter ginkgonis]|nr:SBBP repeat-containing protein [Hymenobacter ginkgonis]